MRIFKQSLHRAGARGQVIFKLGKESNRKIPGIFCDAKNRDDFNLRMLILKQSYSDNPKQSYSDLFRVSIDPRVKPEGDRKESVHEGDRKESVPEGDERGRKPPYDNLKKSSHRVGTRGQTIFELEKNKIGRSLDDCYRNRGMTVKNKCNIEMTVKNKCNRVVAGEKLQKIGMAVWMILLLVSSTSIVRAECTPTPDCASMGYTETSCEGRFVRCPFDTSKLFCAPCDSTYQYACSGEGYLGGEGRACNNKYISCVCADGYEWDNENCISLCNSSSSDWCPVHGNCHVNCCTDGTIEPCDTRCGGSGCVSAGGTSSGISSLSSGEYYFWCCDRNRCDFDGCYSIVGRDCDNNEGYTDCTLTRDFLFCVGPDYISSINFDPTGHLGFFPHNGALYICKHSSTICNGDGVCNSN